MDNEVVKMDEDEDGDTLANLVENMNMEDEEAAVIQEQAPVPNLQEQALVPNLKEKAVERKRKIINIENLLIENSLKSDPKKLYTRFDGDMNKIRNHISFLVKNNEKHANYSSSLRGVTKDGGSRRRRTVHRKRKSHRKSKSKRVRHTRRKQSRRHRHSRRRHH